MFEALGALLGFGTRVFPAILEFFNKKRDNEQELAMMDKQLALEQYRAANKLQEIKAQEDANESGKWAEALQTALGAQGQPTGIKWLDAINSSVRPVLTYWWCLLLYSAQKFILVIVAYQAATPLAGYVQILVTDFDRGVISSILGFWFVDRVLRNMGH